MKTLNDLYRELDTITDILEDTFRKNSFQEKMQSLLNFADVIDDARRIVGQAEDDIDTLQSKLSELEEELKDGEGN